MRQRNRIHSREPKHPTANGTEDEFGSVAVPSTTKKTWTALMFLNRLEVLFQVTAIGLYLLGFLARRNFHTANDCEMTWSWPHFLPIHVPTSSPYGLFKFVDGRDQRFQKFLTTTDHLTGSDWCGRKNETHVVLYIPGHWGSYKQARSLGAHGLQLTRAESDAFSRRAEHAIAHHLWTGVSTEPSTFVYDVYSLDFLNQGAAFHGQFVMAQSEFISEVIMFLTKTCQAKSITLVAHSIGGYAARLTPLAFPQTKKFVKHIITLATPHAGLPFVVDPSVDKIISRIQADEVKELTLISICGGMRDEMIPPLTCFLNSSNAMTVSRLSKCGESFPGSVMNSPIPIQILASDIMRELPSKSKAALGMDHRAIVWCHNLLSTVRDIIFTMQLSDSFNDPVRDKLTKVTSVLGLKTEYSFQDQVKAQLASFRAGYGYWQATVIEAAMLYRFELFLILFALTGSLQLALGSFEAPFLVSLVTSLMASFQADTGLQILSILILSISAHGLYNGIAACLVALKSRFSSDSYVFPLRLCVTAFASVFLLVEISWILCARYLKGYFDVLQWQAALFLTIIVHLQFLLLLSIAQSQTSQRSTTNHCRTISLILPTLPCIVFGKVMLLIGTEECEASSWGITVTVIAPIYLWLLAKHSLRGRSRRPKPASLSLAKPSLITIFCLAYGPRLLCAGCGFRVSHLLSLVLWLNILEATII